MTSKRDLFRNLYILKNSCSRGMVVRTICTTLVANRSRIGWTVCFVMTKPPAVVTLQRIWYIHVYWYYAVKTVSVIFISSLMIRFSCEKFTSCAVTPYSFKQSTMSNCCSPFNILPFDEFRLLYSATETFRPKSRTIPYIVSLRLS